MRSYFDNVADALDGDCGILVKSHHKGQRTLRLTRARKARRRKLYKYEVRSRYGR